MTKDSIETTSPGDKRKLQQGRTDREYLRQMSDEEARAAALSDPDNLPWSEEDEAKLTSSQSPERDGIPQTAAHATS